MPYEDRVLARCLGLAALGFALMLVGHVLGLWGWMVSEGRDFRPPYWWGYLLVYPGATAVADRATRGSWQETTLCICAPPILYFLALGILEGAWLASDGALLGSLATLALTACVAFLGRDKTRA